MVVIVFIVFAILLALFGLAFTALGLANERAYWSQRDPSGDPKHDATGLRVVIKNTWHYATGDVRATLRVAAIGVLMIYIGIGFAIAAALIALLSG